MLKRLGWALLWGVAAYGAGVVLGMELAAALSTNTHDQDLEIVMTGFFCAGPIAGVLGLVISLLWPRRSGPPHKSAEGGLEDWPLLPVFRL